MAGTDSEYFSSYDDLNVHELMLKDKPRTLAYKNFMEQNKHLIEDKVVMDVGAGTGILSMFAARCGASKVYAVEASGISQVCQVLVEQNNMSDIVEVISGRVEDVQMDREVDVIVSEWMGFYLFHESMLESVITARDKFLKENGIILPSTASLYICPVSMRDYYNETFNFWQDVYGFDFSPVLPAIQTKQLSEPKIMHLKADSCIAEPELITHLDLKYIGTDELNKVNGMFSFKSKVNCVMHGFAVWFDVEFEGEHSVTLGTGPASAETHWKQSIVMLPHPLLICKEEQVECMLSLLQNPDHPRRYTIAIQMAEDDDSSDLEDSDSKDLILSAMNQNAS